MVDVDSISDVVVLNEVEFERNVEDEVDNVEDLKIKLKIVLWDKVDVLSNGGEMEDLVKLGEFGWKECYY